MDIPVYTDLSELPTDGSILLALYENAGQISCNTKTPPAQDRGLIFFTGGSGYRPQRGFTLADGSTAFLPDGWERLA